MAALLERFPGQLDGTYRCMIILILLITAVRGQKNNTTIYLPTATISVSAGEYWTESSLSEVYSTEVTSPTIQTTPAGSAVLYSTPTATADNTSANFTWNDSVVNISKSNATESVNNSSPNVTMHSMSPHSMYMHTTAPLRPTNSSLTTVSEMYHRSTDKLSMHLAPSREVTKTWSSPFYGTAQVRETATPPVHYYSHSPGFDSFAVTTQQVLQGSSGQYPTPSIGSTASWPKYSQTAGYQPTLHTSFLYNSSIWKNSSETTEISILSTSSQFSGISSEIWPTSLMTSPNMTLYTGIDSTTRTPGAVSSTYVFVTHTDTANPSTVNLAQYISSSTSVPIVLNASLSESEGSYRHLETSRYKSRSKSIPFLTQTEQVPSTAHYEEVTSTTVLFNVSHVPSDIGYAASEITPTTPLLVTTEYSEQSVYNHSSIYDHSTKTTFADYVDSSTPQPYPSPSATDYYYAGFDHTEETVVPTGMTSRSDGWTTSSTASTQLLTTPSTESLYVDVTETSIPATVSTTTTSYWSSTSISPTLTIDATPTKYWPDREADSTQTRNTVFNTTSFTQEQTTEAMGSVDGSETPRSQTDLPVSSMGFTNEITPSATTPPLTQSTAPTTKSIPVYINQKFVITFNGDCQPLVTDVEKTKEFQQQMKTVIVEYLELKASDVFMDRLACGSVRSYIVIYNATQNYSAPLSEFVSSGDFLVDVGFAEGNTTYRAYKVAEVGVADGAVTPGTGRARDTALGDKDIVLIVIASCICVILIVIGIIICARRMYSKKYAQSFNLMDTPHANLKMEDFTLTQFPRQRLSYAEDGVQVQSYSHYHTNGHPLFPASPAGHNYSHNQSADVDSTLERSMDTGDIRSMEDKTSSFGPTRRSFDFTPNGSHLNTTIHNERTLASSSMDSGSSVHERSTENLMPGLNGSSLHGSVNPIYSGDDTPSASIVSEPPPYTDTPANL